jgi:DNA-binding NtrC family response regulator
VDHFLEKYSFIKDEIMGVSDSAMELLKKYSWPGNIRELENVIQYAIVQSSQNIITINDLPEKFRQIDGGSDETSLKDKLYELSLQLIDSSNVTGRMDAYHEYMRIVEVPIILAALYKSKGNKSLAAHILGINRNTLRSKIKELGMSDE